MHRACTLHDRVVRYLGRLKDFVGVQRHLVLGASRRHAVKGNQCEEHHERIEPARYRTQGLHTSSHFFPV